MFYEEYRGTWLSAWKTHARLLLMLNHEQVSKIKRRESFTDIIILVESFIWGNESSFNDNFNYDSCTSFYFEIRFECEFMPFSFQQACRARGNWGVEMLFLLHGKMISNLKKKEQSHQAYYFRRLFLLAPLHAWNLQRLSHENMRWETLRQWNVQAIWTFAGIFNHVDVTILTQYDSE